MSGLHDHAAVIALFEERHFGRAARRLGVTQPALTARLRRLEMAIGARLFDRDRRGVTPTAAGLAFVEGARRVLDAADEAVEAARSAQDGFGLVLRIGFTQIAAHQVMVPILEAFRRDHGAARLTLSEGTTASLERDLEQSAIDVAFLHPPLHAPGISSRLLYQARMTCRDFHPDGKSRPPVGVPRHKAPVLMGEVDRAWGRLAAAAEPAPTVDADTLIGSLVLSAAGYGPAIVVEDFPDFGFDRVAADRGEPLELETSIAWRSLDRRPAVMALVDLAKPL